MEGWICLGTFALMPVITFFVGYQVGKHGLPYRIVKADEQERRYAVED
jgi:hypothetical protein